MFYTVTYTTAEYNVNFKFESQQPPNIVLSVLCRDGADVKGISLHKPFVLQLHNEWLLKPVINR